MKKILMKASVSFDHKGASIRKGQLFEVSAIDAVILQHKKKATFAKPGSSKPIASTQPPVQVSQPQQSQTVHASQVQTSQMEPVNDEASEPASEPTTGRGRYRRQDLRSRV